MASVLWAVGVYGDHGFSPAPEPVDGLVLTTPAELQRLVTGAVERALNAAPRPAPAPDRPALGYLSNREACASLSVSKATLARWRANGTLAYSKIGGAVFYAVEDVDALLRSNRVAR